MFFGTCLRRELRPRARQAVFTAPRPVLATRAGTRTRIAGRDPVRCRAGLLAAGLAAVALLVAACGGGSPGGPGVANAGSSSSASASSSPSSSAPAGPLALAGCMRAHGITDFPDPDPSGGFDLSGSGDLNPANPAYQAAAQACRSLGRTPTGKSGPTLSPQQQASMLKFAKCMRAHGITNFPDPGINGGIGLPGSIDRHSSQLQAAHQACKQYFVGGPAPRSGS